MWTRSCSAAHTSRLPATARETQRQLVRRGWIRGGTHGTVTLENSLPSELPLSRRLLDLPAED